MSYEIRALDAATTPRRFETLDEVYAYAAGALDVTEYVLERSTLGPWAVWRTGEGPDEEILPAGELLSRAEHWRAR